MSEKTVKKVSSYQKGINKLLKNKEIFEWIIANYMIDTHNKFKSNVFPTTQIAKVVMNKLGKKKTQFPILHKVVREIFSNYWLKEEICEVIDHSRSTSKKTKTVYRITDHGFSVLKSRVIGFQIQQIEGTISTEFEPNIRSREQLLTDYLLDVLDKMDEDEFEDEDNDELNDDDEE